MGENEPRGRGRSTKQWNDVFSEGREVADVPFKEEYEATGNKRDLIEAFFQGYSNPVPSTQIERARTFFATGLDKTDESLPSARAWVHKHKQSGNVAGENISYMTAFQLAEAFKQRGRYVSSRGDFNRSLVDIKHLTQDYGLALIHTVSSNNAAALRAALLGHIARSTALRVVNSTKKFGTFRMELHLPYLTLRDDRTCTAVVDGDKKQRNNKPWADMTFLDRYIREADLKGRSIYAAHATIVVSGWDPTKYTALSFVEPGPSLQADEDEQVDDTEEDDDSDVDDPDSELLPEDAEDKFATYGWQYFLRVRDRSWNPRVCFLHAVRMKITVAVQEYGYLIDHLCRIVDWIETDVFPSTATSSNQDQGRLGQVELSKGVRRITDILIKLRESLAETNRAWTKFTGKHGDIAYFSDLSDALAEEAINAMRNEFDELLGLEQKINSMEEICKILSKTLDTALSEESHNMTRKTLESNGVSLKLNKTMTGIAAVNLRAAEDTSRITHISVYLLIGTSPFVIALQYFTSEQPLFSFERNPRTFFISITVLMALLFISALGLYVFVTYKWALFWKIYAAVGGKKRQPQKHLSEIAAEILKLDDVQEPPVADELAIALV